MTTAADEEQPALSIEGRARVVVTRVEPSVDDGRFAVKRVQGEALRVTVEAVCDGHDALAARLTLRPRGAAEGVQIAMEPSGQDRWSATITAGNPGAYEYLVSVWVDRFASWQRDLGRRRADDEEMRLELAVGAQLSAEAASSASGPERDLLVRYAADLRSLPVGEAVERALDPDITRAVRAVGPTAHASVVGPLLLVVEPPHARFSAWYEFFPRSTGSDGMHGTFRTAEGMLQHVADMGFDTVYLPPIHPIGRKNRKGRNNTTTAEPGDVGSPWAIGSAEGGHTAIHPDLGTLADFRNFRIRAEELGLRVALDIAFQCAPDHPWVAEHPNWFRQRPDGSIRYAENPPKRYEDIVPFDFESDDWEALWQALLEVVLFWVGEGVTIFRVDNPHTKPLRFWEWLIGNVKARHPEAIFLAEAFTRPALLEGLAKRGFSQSYNYFAWRNTGWELREYLTQLTQTDRIEYLRANLWPNTPDILTEYLQAGGRPAFAARAALAATLGASYGVYGPPFELSVASPLASGSEEYLDSEKYQLRSWRIDDEWSLRDLLTRLNAIRREHAALHQDRTLRFHSTDTEQLLCYSKTDGDDVVLVVVNVDPHFTHRGNVTLDVDVLGIDVSRPYQVHDLLGSGRYLWSGPTNFVELAPGQAHVFALRTRLRREHDFDYYQ